MEQEAKKQEAEKKVKTKKKSTLLVTSQGVAYVVAGFNNTIVTITNTKGQVVCRSSSGAVGFKGTRKSTPFAASIAAEKAGGLAFSKGVREVDVLLKGPGQGRLSAVKSLRGAGIRVNSITDITPMPHNGCRPRKRRHG